MGFNSLQIQTSKTWQTINSKYASNMVTLQITVIIKQPKINKGG